MLGVLAASFDAFDRVTSARLFHGVLPIACASNIFCIERNESAKERKCRGIAQSETRETFGASSEFQARRVLELCNFSSASLSLFSEIRPISAV